MKKILAWIVISIAYIIHGIVSAGFEALGWALKQHEDEDEKAACADH